MSQHPDYCPVCRGIRPWKLCPTCGLWACVTCFQHHAHGKTVTVDYGEAIHELAQNGFHRVRLPDPTHYLGDWARHQQTATLLTRDGLAYEAIAEKGASVRIVEVRPLRRKP